MDFRQQEGKPYGLPSVNPITTSRRRPPPS